MKKSMPDLLSEYYAAFQRAHGQSYQQKYGKEIEIHGSWFKLGSCNVQRKMMETMIDRLNHSPHCFINC